MVGGSVSVTDYSIDECIGDATRPTSAARSSAGTFTPYIRRISYNGFGRPRSSDLPRDARNG
jgi:hypothetical protein